MFHSGNVSRTPPLLLALIPTVSDRDPHPERAPPFLLERFRIPEAPGYCDAVGETFFFSWRGGGGKLNKK